MGQPMPHIGLLGLGRTGRALFRVLHDREDMCLAAVRDPADPKALAYLLRFDSELGRLPVAVTVAGDHLDVGGRQVRLLPGKPSAGAPAPTDPAAATPPWGDLGIDTVIDSTGRASRRIDLERHLTAGARRVIVCAPDTPANGGAHAAPGLDGAGAADAPDVLAVAGVNDDELRAAHRIVACASPAVHAAAPAAMLLGEAFGIRRAFLTAVEAFGDDQRLADVPDDDPRRGRAAAENIIPQDFDATATLEAVLPALRGKLTGLGMNVPVADGSGLDLVCWHERPVSVETVNEVMRQAAAAPRWAGVLAYEDAPIVSSDVLHRGVSATFDSLATMVLAGNVSKTLTWYDSAWGLAHRVVDLVRRFQALDGEEKA
jgi:glyceraldehyde 3-phosphate dehydrogenase